MFESDDFDQVLSQLDYIEATPDVNTSHKQPLQSSCLDQQNSNVRNCVSPNKLHVGHNKSIVLKSPPMNGNSINFIKKQTSSASHFEDYYKIEIAKDDRTNSTNNESHKQSKKRLIGTLFDHRSKRKFPGPAGLLIHSRNHCEEENLSHLEISSQDVDFCEEHLHPSAFDHTLWTTLQKDIISRGIDQLDTINCIKQKEISGRLPSRKAHTLTAFVEAVDRSVDDPLIILRDMSGTIKCTLHRDAWSEFATCLMSEYVAIALWKPTVLTTGTTYKRHYLNITLSNIIAVYYSNNAILEEKPVPNGYSVTVFEGFVAVKKDDCNFSKGDSFMSTNLTKELDHAESTYFLDGLDSVSFLEEDF